MPLLGFGTSAAVADTSSVTNRAITIPAGAIVGQPAFIAGGYNQQTTDTTTPAGWTLLRTIDFSVTFRARLYFKTLVGGDPGSVVNFANATAQRQGFGLWTPTAATGQNVHAGLAEVTPGTAHANATATSTAVGGQVIFFVERSSTPSATATPGGTWTARSSAFGTGAGAVSVAIADKVTAVASGSTIGTATWTASVSNSGVVTFVVGVTQVPQGGVNLTDGNTLQYHMNRLAGTLFQGVPLYDAQRAANIWAGTTALPLVDALNTKAGNTLPAYKELVGVLNQLANTTGLAQDGAAASIP